MVCIIVNELIISCHFPSVYDKNHYYECHNTYYCCNIIYDIIQGLICDHLAQSLGFVPIDNICEVCDGVVERMDEHNGQQGLCAMIYISQNQTYEKCIESLRRIYMYDPKDDGCYHDTCNRPIFVGQ